MRGAQAAGYRWAAGTAFPAEDTWPIGSDVLGRCKTRCHIRFTGNVVPAPSYAELESAEMLVPIPLAFMGLPGSEKDWRIIHHLIKYYSTASRSPSGHHEIYLCDCWGSCY